MPNETKLLVDRYQIGKVIGRGGMADVYLGFDTKLERKVAIKVLRSHLADDPAFRARFKQEALASSKMTHPGIVRIFDAGEDFILNSGENSQTQPFLVMEWVDGTLLKDIIAEAPLSVEIALEITDQILAALQYSHRAGIIHRDVKPSNIMLTQDGKAKIMDFGIARAVSDSSATVEETQAVLGTAQYFSPEQARGETVDARTDIYSLGVTLFEMLTGQAPFTGESAVAVAYQHVNVDPPVPSSLEVSIPEAIDRLVLKAITKSRDLRFQNAGEFRAAIKGALNGMLIKVPEPEESQFTTIDELLGEDEDAAELFREISSGQESISGTQRRPPMVWLWVSIITIVAMLGALGYWIINLTAPVPDTQYPKIPQLAGKTWEEAELELNNINLKPVKYEESSETIPEGQVLRTDPMAGLSVQEMLLVRVYVSSGVAKITIPDFGNVALKEVQAELKELGLEVGKITKKNSATVPNNSVMESSPKFGSEVVPGTVVNLTVSNGKIDLKNYKGKPLQATTLELTRMGLRVVHEANTSCKSEKDLPITNQSPAPGEIKQQSEVTLYYCTGLGN